MKAIQLATSGGIRRAQWVDIDEPAAPKAGEISVRLHAASLNYHDYLVARDDGRGTGHLIPLSDGAGVVEAIGSGVTEFAVGDAVLSCFFPFWQHGAPTFDDFRGVPGDGFDGYARERVVTPARWFVRAPVGYSHAESSTLTVAALTAWRALVVNGAIRAGESVLVLGTGGVAIFAIQFAKAMGASVIVTSSSDRKLERMKALGVDHAINYRSEPDWGQAVRRLTGGRGVDHVVELGGPGTLAQSLAAARVGGHVSMIGVLTGYAGNVPLLDLMRRQIKLQGLIAGHRGHLQDMVRAIDATGLRPLIDRHFALPDISQAYACLESAEHVGKIVVDIQA